MKFKGFSADELTALAHIVAEASKYHEFCLNRFVHGLPGPFEELRTLPENTDVKEVDLAENFVSSQLEILTAIKECIKALAPDYYEDWEPDENQIMDAKHSLRLKKLKDSGDAYSDI